MHNVSERAGEAFVKRLIFFESKTSVTGYGTGIVLSYGGNELARRKPSLGFDDAFGLDIEICDGGYPSATTANRLNGLLSQYSLEIKATLKSGKIYAKYQGIDIPVAKRFFELGENFVFLRDIFKYFQQAKEQKPAGK